MTLLGFPFMPSRACMRSVLLRLRDCWSIVHSCEVSYTKSHRLIVSVSVETVPVTTPSTKTSHPYSALLPQEQRSAHLAPDLCSSVSLRESSLFLPPVPSSPYPSCSKSPLPSSCPPFPSDVCTGSTGTFPRSRTPMRRRPSCKRSILCLYSFVRTHLPTLLNFYTTYHQPAP
jgi:hypothetical protein